LYHEYFKATANADSVFRYSTMQFNRDYAAALHIDRNNEGPCYSIGLGGRDVQVSAFYLSLDAIR
jgi:hypothetical protein